MKKKENIDPGGETAEGRRTSRRAGRGGVDVAPGVQVPGPLRKRKRLKKRREEKRKRQNRQSNPLLLHRDHPQDSEEADHHHLWSVPKEESGKAQRLGKENPNTGARRRGEERRRGSTTLRVSLRYSEEIFNATG